MSNITLYEIEELRLNISNTFNSIIGIRPRYSKLKEVKDGGYNIRLMSVNDIGLTIEIYNNVVRIYNVYMTISQLDVYLHPIIETMLLWDNIHDNKMISIIQFDNNNCINVIYKKQY